MATNIAIEGFSATIDLPVRDAVVTRFDCRLEISASTTNIGSQFDLGFDGDPVSLDSTVLSLIIPELATSPGLGNRNISQDGHFVDVTLESFPALP